MVRQRSALIIESNVDLLRSITRQFDEAGFIVFKAVTGKGGRTVLSKVRPEIIMISRTLPDESSLEICRDIRRNAFFAHTQLFMLATDQSLLSSVSEADFRLLNGAIDPLRACWLDELLKKMRVR